MKAYGLRISAKQMHV